MSRNDLAESNPDYLKQSMARNNKLEKAEFNDCNFGDNSAIGLFTGLTKNATLLHLNV